jgi:hypothetical protein
MLLFLLIIGRIKGEDLPQMIAFHLMCVMMILIVVLMGRCFRNVKQMTLTEFKDVITQMRNATTSEKDCSPNVKPSIDTVEWERLEREIRDYCSKHSNSQFITLQFETNKIYHRAVSNGLMLWETEAKEKSWMRFSKFFYRHPTAEGPVAPVHLLSSDVTTSVQINSPFKNGENYLVALNDEYPIILSWVFHTLLTLFGLGLVSVIIWMTNPLLSQNKMHKIPSLKVKFSRLLIK